MSARKIIAIGGSDAGISAALRARELDPTSEVTVVVADAYPNFSICGIPYYVSGEGTHWSNLAHRTAASFGADRTRAAAHLFARACGHELASSVPEAAAGHEKESDIALLARTMREFSEASAQYAAAAENGISPEEARALLPEVDQALDQLQAIRNRLQSSVDGLRPALKVAGALTYGHKA